MKWFISSVHYFASVARPPDHHHILKPISITAKSLWANGSSLWYGFTRGLAVGIAGKHMLPLCSVKRVCWYKLRDAIFCYWCCFSQILHPRKKKEKNLCIFLLDSKAFAKPAFPACSAHWASACLFCFGCSNLHSVSSHCVDFKVTKGSSCIFCKSGCKQVWITHVLLLCPPLSLFFCLFLRFRLASRMIWDPFKDPIWCVPASSKPTT